jgi:hypothetical protein
MAQSQSKRIVEVVTKGVSAQSLSVDSPADARTLSLRTVGIKRYHSE